MQIEEKQIVINGQNITLRSPGKQDAETFSEGHPTESEIQRMFLWAISCGAWYAPARWFPSVRSAWDVNLIVNHINSTPRESLEGHTPYDAALKTLGEDVLKAFQLKTISPDEVNLTPKLIRFKK